jgi:hypothetical protein
MVSSVDAIAWTNHGPSREGGMRKFLSSLFKKPDAPMSVDDIMKRIGEASYPPEGRPEGAEGIIYDFAREIYIEGANWPLEEIQRRKNDCINRVSAYRAAENARDREEFSNSLRRQIEVGKFDQPPSSKPIPTTLAVSPFRPRKEVQEEVKELAKHLSFIIK